MKTYPTIAGVAPFPENRFWAALVGALISVPAFQYVVTIIDFDGSVSVTRIFIDSIAGCLAYFCAFKLLRNRLRASGAISLTLPAILGSFLWIVYKVLKGLFLDLDFLAANPSTIYPRHLPIAALALMFVTVTFLSVMFVGSSVMIWRLLAASRQFWK